MSGAPPVFLLSVLIGIAAALVRLKRPLFSWVGATIAASASLVAFYPRGTYPKPWIFVQIIVFWFIGPAIAGFVAARHVPDGFLKAAAVSAGVWFLAVMAGFAVVFGFNGK